MHPGVVEVPSHPWMVEVHLYLPADEAWLFPKAQTSISEHCKLSCCQIRSPELAGDWGGGDGMGQMQLEKVGSLLADRALVVKGHLNHDQLEKPRGQQGGGVSEGGGMNAGQTRGNVAAEEGTNLFSPPTAPSSAHSSHWDGRPS